MNTNQAVAVVLVLVVTIIVALPAGAWLQTLSKGAGFDLAAWTQAVGSVIGIAVAIYVPWSIQRQDVIKRETEESAAKALAEDALLKIVDTITGLADELQASHVSKSDPAAVNRALSYLVSVLRSQINSHVLQSFSKELGAQDRRIFNSVLLEIEQLVAELDTEIHRDFDLLTVTGSTGSILSEVLDRASKFSSAIDQSVANYRVRVSRT